MIRSIELSGRHDIQHNDIQHNDTQHSGTQHKGPVNMYRVISVDFRRYPFLVLIHLNILKQVPNPLLGLALALASILAPNNG